MKKTSDSYLGKLKIGSKNYEVHALDNLPGGDAGATDHQRGYIAVSTYGCPDEVRDTLVHEAIHGILHEYGLSYMLEQAGVSEEQFVKILTTGLLATLDVKVPVRK